MFWHNEEFAMGLGRDIHLDGVLCVVDAVFGQKVRPVCGLSSLRTEALLI